MPVLHSSPTSLSNHSKLIQNVSRDLFAEYLFIIYQILYLAYLCKFFHYHPISDLYRNSIYMSHQYSCRFLHMGHVHCLVNIHLHLKKHFRFNIFKKCYARNYVFLNQQFCRTFFCMKACHMVENCGPVDAPPNLNASKLTCQPCEVSNLEV